MTSTTVEEPVKDSIFIIDWDNTLFSTDYLKNMGFQFEYYFDKTKDMSEIDFLLDGFLIKDISSLEDVLFPLIHQIGADLVLTTHL